MNAENTLLLFSLTCYINTAYIIFGLPLFRPFVFKFSVSIVSKYVNIEQACEAQLA